MHIEFIKANSIGNGNDLITYFIINKSVYKLKCDQNISIFYTDDIIKTGCHENKLSYSNF